MAQIMDDAQFRIWKTQLVPLIYDWFSNHNLTWPTQACRCVHGWQEHAPAGRDARGETRSPAVCRVQRARALGAAACAAPPLCSMQRLPDPPPLRTLAHNNNPLLRRRRRRWGRKLENHTYKDRYRIYLSEQVRWLARAGGRAGSSSSMQPSCLPLHLRAGASALQRSLGSARSAALARQRSLAQQPPKTLYHYDRPTHSKTKPTNDQPTNHPTHTRHHRPTRTSSRTSRRSSTSSTPTSASRASPRPRSSPRGRTSRAAPSCATSRRSCTPAR